MFFTGPWATDSGWLRLHDNRPAWPLVVCFGGSCSTSAPPTPRRGNKSAFNMKRKPRRGRESITGNALEGAVPITQEYDQALSAPLQGNSHKKVSIAIHTIKAKKFLAQNTEPLFQKSSCLLLLQPPFNGPPNIMANAQHQFLYTGNSQRCSFPDRSNRR